MLNRNRRTLLLGVLATLTLAWSAVYHFDVPLKDMLWLALYSALGVFSIIFLAALSVAALQLLKWLLRRLRHGDKAAGD